MSLRAFVKRNRERAKEASVRAPKRPADPAGAPRPSTWRERALAALSSGDEREALRICARHVRTGEHARAIGIGWEAMQRPDFQRSIGRDPAALVADGLTAAREVIGR